MSTRVDWGDGAYEVFSPALRPAAERLVELARPTAGERAIDLGCGDGNVSLPLVRAGAHVTAVDPSLRLLGLADQRVRDDGHQLTTVVGTAESLPLPDGDASLVLSNFGLIFTPEPGRAVAEALRVLAPGGRLLYSAWLPTGPIAQIGQAFGAAITGDATVAESPSPISWHQPATLAPLVPGGASAITAHHGEIDFHAPSAQAFNDEQAEHHPMWRAMREALGDEQAWEQLMREATAILKAASPPDRFLVRSQYVVVEIHPGS